GLLPREQLCCAAACCGRESFPDKDRASPTLGKELLYFADSGSQRIHLRRGVVKRHRRSRRSGDLKAVHYRLSTVMTCPHGDTFLAENGANVVRVCMIDYEREHARFMRRGPDNPDAPHLRD